MLESLRDKGWIKVYSGSPLLFKAISPDEIFEKYKENYERMLSSVKDVLEVEKMEEKFVIASHKIDFENFKEIIREAKTVWISNTTSEFLEEIRDSLRDDAEVRVVLFPGERIVKIKNKNLKMKEADVKIVHRVRNVEVPAISVILDEERVFNVFRDVNDEYVISEMLYDECNYCLREWWNLGWGE